MAYASSAAARKKRKKKRSFDAAKFRGVRIKMEEIDYKNVAGLQRLTTAQGKIFSRKRSGLAADAQRAVTEAVKRARFMALLPFVS
jgi:small subunit ribosomal protein S18